MDRWLHVLICCSRPHIHQTACGSPSTDYSAGALGPDKNSRQWLHPPLRPMAQVGTFVLYSAQILRGLLAFLLSQRSTLDLARFSRRPLFDLDLPTTSYPWSRRKKLLSAFVVLAVAGLVIGLIGAFKPDAYNKKSVEVWITFYLSLFIRFQISLLYLFLMHLDNRECMSFMSIRYKHRVWLRTGVPCRQRRWVSSFEHTRHTRFFVVL